MFVVRLGTPWTTSGLRLGPFWCIFFFVQHDISKKNILAFSPQRKKSPSSRPPNPGHSSLRLGLAYELQGNQIVHWRNGVKAEFSVGRRRSLKLASQSSSVHFHRRHRGTFFFPRPNKVHFYWPVCSTPDGRLTGKSKSIKLTKMKGNEQRKQQGRFLSNSGEDGSKPSTRSRWRAAGEDGGGDIHQRERWLKLELEIYQGFASHGGRSEEGGGRMDHVRLRKRSRRKWRNDQLGPFRVQPVLMDAVRLTGSVSHTPQYQILLRAFPLGCTWTHTLHVNVHFNQMGV